MFKFCLVILSFAVSPAVLTLRASAQKPQCTAIIPLNDTSIQRFTNLFDFMPLYQNNKPILSHVKKILQAKSYADQRKNLNKILNTRSSGALCLLAFDYYFQRTAPLPGTNVERFLSIIQQHSLYKEINEVYQFQIKDTTHLRDSVWAKIGWQFGYGAFYYLSPNDSVYMANMQTFNPEHLDEQVVDIIEHYVAQQQPIFKYDKAAIVKEVLEVPGVVNAIMDDCLTKTLQLPNYDQLHIEYVRGKDTIERVYTVQIGASTARLQSYINNYVLRPLKIKPASTDYVFYKDAHFVLHGYKRTKQQCDENYRQYLKSRQAYQDFLNQQDPQ